jgi:cytoskeletal protein RodZ
VGRFGEKLRRERELREITLEEVATATKIGTRSLRALEEEKFEQLPGGVFNRGFVRAYARYVGIDEEEAVLDFTEALKAAEKSKELNDISIIAKQVESSRARELGARRRGALAFAWTLIAVMAIAGAAVAGWPYLEKWRLRDSFAKGKLEKLQSLYQQVQAASSTPAPKASAPAPEVTPTVPASATPSPTPASVENRPAEDGLSLVVTFKQRCWLEVKADGKVATSGTVDPSTEAAERTFTAHDRLVLITGNPNGIELTFNGQPLKLPGPTNVARTLTFTTQGLQQD